MFKSIDKVVRASDDLNSIKTESLDEDDMSGDGVVMQTKKQSKQPPPKRPAAGLVNASSVASSFDQNIGNGRPSMLSGLSGLRNSGDVDRQIPASRIKNKLRQPEESKSPLKGINQEEGKISPE